MLVIRRVMHTVKAADDQVQRENIFHSGCTIRDKVCRGNEMSSSRGGGQSNKGKNLTHSSNFNVDHLVQAVQDVNLDSSQNGGLASQTPKPNPRGQPDAQRTGQQTNAPVRAPNNVWAVQTGSRGVANNQPVNRYYDNNHNAATNAIPPPIQSEWNWNSRPTGNAWQPGDKVSNCQAFVTEENVEDSNENEEVDEYDSDESPKTHEERRKNRRYAEFFSTLDTLDTLTVDQVNEPTRQWHCPACKNGPSAIDWYKSLQSLVTHAKTKGSKIVKIHRDLAIIFEEELRRKGATVNPAGKSFGQWKKLNADVKDKEIVWPPIVIIMNTWLERDENGKRLGMVNQKLLDYFGSYEAVRSHHFYGPKGCRGMSVLIFESSAVGYTETERLPKANIVVESQTKEDYLEDLRTSPNLEGENDAKLRPEKQKFSAPQKVTAILPAAPSVPATIAVSAPPSALHSASVLHQNLHLCHCLRQCQPLEQFQYLIGVQWLHNGSDVHSVTVSSTWFRTLPSISALSRLRASTCIGSGPCAFSVHISVSVSDLGSGPQLISVPNQGSVSVTRFRASFIISALSKFRASTCMDSGPHAGSVPLPRLRASSTVSAPDTFSAHASASVSTPQLQCQHLSFSSYLFFSVISSTLAFSGFRASTHLGSESLPAPALDPESEPHASSVSLPRFSIFDKNQCFIPFSASECTNASYHFSTSESPIAACHFSTFESSSASDNTDAPDSFRASFTISDYLRYNPSPDVINSNGTFCEGISDPISPH